MSLEGRFVRQNPAPVGVVKLKGAGKEAGLVRDKEVKRMERQDKLR